MGDRVYGPLHRVVQGSAPRGPRFRPPVRLGRPGGGGRVLCWATVGANRAPPAGLPRLGCPFWTWVRGFSSIFLPWSLARRAMIKLTPHGRDPLWGACGSARAGHEGRVVEPANGHAEVGRPAARRRADPAARGVRERPSVLHPQGNRTVGRLHASRRTGVRRPVRKTAVFSDTGAETAHLSNAQQYHQLFGHAHAAYAMLIEHRAEWRGPDRP